MSYQRQSKLPLFEPNLSWQRLPEKIQQQALDVLTHLYLDIVSPPNKAESKETKEHSNESND